MTSPKNQIMVPKEKSFLQACKDGDEDMLFQLIARGLSKAEINEQDKTGRTGLSHACANGHLSVLEVLVSINDVDVNLADNEGNTPLIFAAQADQSEIVSYLLNYFKDINVDQSNLAGLTALMKAAVQGRKRCAKLLLFAGASPALKDPRRNLTAAEWARFCGRHVCAETIIKFTKNAHHKQSSIYESCDTLDMWSSEPDLPSLDSSDSLGGKSGGNWFKRRLQRAFRVEDNRAKDDGQKTDFSPLNNLALAVRCASTPILPSLITPPSSPKLFRSKNKEIRPRLVVPKLEITKAPSETHKNKLKKSGSGKHSKKHEYNQIINEDKY